MRLQKIWAPALSLMVFGSCQSEEADPGFFVGTWNLREKHFVTPTDHTVTYHDAGQIIYDFKENATVLITETGLPPQTKTWTLRGEDEDTIGFDAGPPWKITEKGEDNFKAQFHQFSDGYHIYTFSK